MEAIEQRRCTATNRAGERCSRRPIRGGDVCIMHGGLAPQTLAAARLRLLEGRDLAIDALLRTLQSHGPPCPVCERSDGDRDPAVIRAAQIVLDRTGFGPSANLNVTRTPMPVGEYEQWLSEEEMSALREVFEDYLAEAKRRCEAGEPKRREMVTRIVREIVDPQVIVGDS